MATHEHHAIDYIEITVTDVAAAKRFYGAAFDWTFNDYGPDYAGINGTEREVGGFAKGEVTARRAARGAVLEATRRPRSRGVREAGGTLTKEPFEFPGGRRFQFLDPSGNELAVWSERIP